MHDMCCCYKMKENNNILKKNTPRYRQVYDILKRKIQQGDFLVGDYLPSENDLCATFNITRTTARKALEELQRDGFILRQHGKGSLVRERRESLGLLTVKGFSEAVNQQVKTKLLENPQYRNWSLNLSFKPTEKEKADKCIFFSRLRYVNNHPVMIEDNWLSEDRVPNFTENKFVEGSFFKTLSQRYLIEIVGSEQELRALPANKTIAGLLQLEENAPILHITVKYLTSIPDYYIYSQLYCNTDRYPIGNNYLLK